MPTEMDLGNGDFVLVRCVQVDVAIKVSPALQL